MIEHLTISNQPLEHPGMDFALLRREGIKHIERLGGKLWTDYNTHDPGITILEQLCYAITDLSYRLDFEMKDLLAPPPGESRKQFFTAREILTTNPVTINDYRKLLIDIDGVKNAFLEPITDSYPEFYYNSNRHILTFASSEVTQEVNLNGLYRVFIDKEQAYSDAELLAQVTAKLNQYRNLCEDFAKIEILPVEQVAVQAEIEIEAGFDVNELMAKIYFGLDVLVAPDLHFFTLKELIEQGKSTEQIFDGVPLEHGFIDDEQLENFVRRDELRTSDFIQIILDIAGIKTIKSITLSGNKSLNEEWVLPLEVNHTARLKNISAAAQDITFYKNQIVCQPNPEKISEKLELLKQSHQKQSAIQLNPANLDLAIPQGEYRELSDYISIQHEFPTNYGIGDLGLPASASAQRKAQAKQLQAYLMFFDQLLANYLTQLDRAKDLFSFNNQSNQTYFNQELTNIPGFQEIFTEYPQDILENKVEQQARKNRFFDHLIAQYCEKFTDYSLLLYESILNQNETDNREINTQARRLNNKISFLNNYPKLSAERGQGFNYLDPNIVTNIENVAGFKQKICSLLDIPYTRQTLASSGTTEGFHLIEHILLRPKTKKLSPDSPDNFLDFSYQISDFSQSTTDSTKITCTSVGHGLIENEQIRIFGTRNYNGTYYVSNIEQDTFDLKKRFIQSDQGQWIEVNQPQDPYSFQLSFIFPNWLPRFQDASFKQLMYNVINTELPAHITPYYYWLNQAEMREFETAYNHWLNTAMNNNASPEELQATINNLIELSQIGSVEVTPFNLIGYMTIGDDFTVI